MKFVQEATLKQLRFVLFQTKAVKFYGIFAAGLVNVPTHKEKKRFATTLRSLVSYRFMDTSTLKISQYFFLALLTCLFSLPITHATFSYQYYTFLTLINLCSLFSKTLKLHIITNLLFLKSQIPKFLQFV